MKGPTEIAAVLLGMTLLLSASAATAECRPSGRKPFVAGLEALNRGDLPVAAQIFYRLVEAQPRCAEARNNLAVVFVEQGRLDEAAEQLRQALEVNPDYRRARVNLGRVEELLRAQRDSTTQTKPGSDVQKPPAAPEPAPTQDVDAEGAQTKLAEVKQTQVEPTPTEATHPGAQRGEPAFAEAQIIGPPLPAAGATAAPRGTTACVIEPAQNRLCLYQRTAGTNTSNECYPIALAQVRSWPRWVVASEVSPKRIRLLDETGQTRLEIVAEDVAVSGDALHLRRGDLEALAGKIVPWRTGWLILE
jgi:tetratricopeptide (TPR) repeat protein